MAEAAGYVNDFAHVISSDQAQQIENLLSDLEQKTGAEVAVVTVDTVEGGDVDGAAVDLFKAWGIGKKGKDNGVLILAAIGDRKGRIEVGYGLESLITDGQAGSILRQDIYPFFKQKDYGQGLANGAREVGTLITGNNGVPADSQTENQESDQMGGPAISSGVAFLIKAGIVLLVLIIYTILGGWRQRRYWGGYYGGGFGGGGWGGGGGFGGGGFGGFGGGGSGGGGASGGW